MPELKLLEQKTSYELIEDPQKLGFAVEELKKHDVLAVDLEATSLDPHNTIILLVQIGTPERAYVFDARKLDLAPLDCATAAILLTLYFPPSPVAYL